MKLLVDINLSPKLSAVLQGEGWDSVHWSEVGSPSAPDHEIMAWAREHSRIVLTHDLDFGTLLALSRSTGPSVVQIRVQDVRHESISPMLISLLRQYQSELEAGALLVADESRARVRVLPLTRNQED